MSVRIDTPKMDVETASMSNRIKRTYNLSSEAVAHVRDLASRDGLPASQDAVVELAIDHLYRKMRDRDDAAQWARAAVDASFRSEIRSVAEDLADAERWPAE